MSEIVIRTTENQWLKSLAVAYKSRKEVLLIDDAHIGINPLEDTLFKMGLKAKLSRADIVAVCASLGIGAVGVALIVGAFLDPEPTSKLLLIISSGVLLVFSGGFTAVRILTKLLPPIVDIGADGFTIRWE